MGLGKAQPPKAEAPGRAQNFWLKPVRGCAKSANALLLEKVAKRRGGKPPLRRSPKSIKKPCLNALKPTVWASLREYAS